MFESYLLTSEKEVALAKELGIKSAKAAGFPKGFRPLYGLRHVFASMLASSGKVDLYTLQKLLTHKDPKMTQRYAHLRDDTLKRASNWADKLIRDIYKNHDKDKSEEKKA